MALGPRRSLVWRAVKARGRATNNSFGGYSHMLVWADGTVYSCGDNTYSQCGYSKQKKVPFEEVEGLKDIVCVSAGTTTSTALRADGKVLTWGWGEYGCLGHGNIDSVKWPKVVERYVSSAANVDILLSVLC